MPGGVAGVSGRPLPLCRSSLDDYSGRPVPYLDDYLIMLAEFDAVHKALDVAQLLSRTAQARAEEAAGSSAALLNLLTRVPSTARTVMGLGRTLAPGNPQGAFEAYEQAAEIAVATNDPGTASEVIEKALEIHPNDGSARRIRGQLRWRAGEIQGAADDFAAAVTSNPDDVDSRVALAHAALELNETQKAAAELSIVLSKQPVHVDALWLQGLAELRKGEVEASQGNHEASQAQWTVAIGSFTAALDQRPDHPACRRSRAIALHHLGQFSEALEDLDLSLNPDPTTGGRRHDRRCTTGSSYRSVSPLERRTTPRDDVEGHGWRGVVLYALGRHDEALVAVNTGLAMIGNNARLQTKRPWLLGTKGRALRAKNLPDQAIEVFSEAIGLDPGNKDIMRGLLEAYSDKQDWSGLAQCARNLQQSAALSTDCFLNLHAVEIMSLRNARRYGDAFAALDREPRLNMGNPDDVWLRVRLLADIGNFEEARQVMANIGPENASVVDLLSLRGWVVQNLEPRDTAERTELGVEGQSLYKKAIELASQDPKNKTQEIWLRKGLANALLRSGARRDAFVVYEQVIAECERIQREHAPNSRILALTGWCYHCRGDNAAASGYYEGALNSGDPTIAIEFDYALVLTAAASPDVTQEATPGVSRYQSTIAKLGNEDVLRRIGFLRIALHDLRELSFRGSDLANYAEIQALLAGALHEALDDASGAPPGYADRLEAFLEVVDGSPAPQLTQAVEADAASAST
jgi:tetratricopeptide (TPR) repeat protein